MRIGELFAGYGGLGCSSPPGARPDQGHDECTRRLAAGLLDRCGCPGHQPVSAGQTGYDGSAPGQCDLTRGDPTPALPRGGNVND